MTSDSSARERGACLFVAGIIDPKEAESIAQELDALAAEAMPTKPAYGSPASLATLVRARAKFFGGGCVVDPARPDVLTPAGSIDESVYDVPVDFYAAYHVPFFFSWAACEKAALRAARGDRAAALDVLRPLTTKAPERTWIMDDIERYER